MSYEWQYTKNDSKSRVLVEKSVILLVGLSRSSDMRREDQASHDENALATIRLRFVCLGLDSLLLSIVGKTLSL